jgi:hypothetical protein
MARGYCRLGGDCGRIAGWTDKAADGGAAWGDRERIAAECERPRKRLRACDIGIALYSGG